VSSVVSLFLLSQVFLIITHVPLVHILASIILTGDMDIFSQGASEKLASYRVVQVSHAPIRLGYTRVYPEVSRLAAWSESCKWYSSLPLGAVVSLFCEPV